MSDKLLAVKIQVEDGATKVFQTVGNSAKTMGQAVQQGAATGTKSLHEMEQAANSVGTSLAVAGGTVSAVFGLTSRSANTLESAMKNVNSIAGLTSSELEQLTGQVRELAKVMGESPTELASGLYDIQSSGFEAADALNILDKSVTAAGAGITDTAVAAKAITAVLNAYQKTAADAGDVSDVLFKIVDSGVITFEQLAQNLGSVLPPAAALKVPLEEVAAAFAELTLQGINASQAETGIAAFMRSAIAPTEALTAAVEEYGYASAEALLKAEGIVGFLKFLQQETGGSSTALQELLGSTESTTTAMALLRNEGENYTATLGEMNAAAQDGAYTQGVFAEQTDTTAFAIQKFVASIRDLGITMGDALSPFIRFGAEALTSVTNGVSELPAPIQTAVALFGALGGAATLAGGALLLVIPKVLEFRAAMTTLGGVSGMFSLIAGAINPVTLALGALTIAGGVGLAMWGKHKEGVRRAEEEYKQLQATLLRTEDIIRGLNLTGDFELAEKVKAQRDEIVAIWNDFPNQLSDVNWFGNLALYQDDNIDTIKAPLLDFLNKGVGEAVAEFAVDGEAKNLFGQSLADIFGITQADLEKIVDLGYFSEFLATRTEDEIRASTGLLQQAAQEYYAAMLPTDADKAVVTESLNSLLDLYSNPNIDVSRLDAEISRLFDLMVSGGHDATWLNEQLKLLFQDITVGSDKFDILNGSLDDFGTSADTAGQKATTFFGILKEGLDSIGGSFEESLPEQSWFDRLVESTGVTGKYDVDAWWAALPWNQPPPEIPENVKDTKEEWIAYINEVPQFSPEWQARTEEAKAWAEEQEAIYDQQIANMQERNRASATADQQFLADKRAAIEEQMQIERDYIGQAMELAGVDTFGEQLDFVGLGTQYTALASDIMRANDAMNDGFRIVVQNTDAIGQNVQAIEDWARELIGVEGEWAKIDELLASGAISQQEYNDAQQAYNTIAETNKGIQEDILAIQAKQAPIIADLTEKQGEYIDSLADMPADQQMIALGWMDAAESAKAYNATQIIVAAANGELGESGKLFAQNTIDGLIAADPYLKAMLQDLGYIKENGDINFDVATTGMDQFDRLIGSVQQLTDLLDDGKFNNSIPVDFTVTGDEAIKDAKMDLSDITAQEWKTAVDLVTTVNGEQTSDPMGALGRALGSFGGGSGGPGHEGGAPGVSITITAIDEFTPVADASLDKFRQIDEASPVADIGADNSMALAAIGHVDHELGRIDGATATVMIVADTSDAQAGINWASRFDGDVLSTSYVDIVTRNYSTTGGYALGGIPGFARGGVVAELAESGPEILHFANGGTAAIYDRGLYAVPPMTYVSPNNANPGLGGGMNVNVYVQGNVVTENDLTLSIANAIAPAWTEALRQERAGGARL